MLIMGPKLLALFPLWLLGSLVYTLHAAARPRPIPAPGWVFLISGAAVLLVVASSGAVGIDHWADTLSQGWLTSRLRFSQWFVGDFLLASLFALNLLAARYVALDFGRMTGTIKILAAYTFTFYMVHGPVLKMFTKYVYNGMIAATLVTIGFSFVFGLGTERQKNRVHRWLSHGLAVIEPWFGRRRPALPGATRS